MTITADTLTRAMTEKDLQQCVMDTARLLGWRCFHPWRSDHSAAGFPDTVCVRSRPAAPAQLIFCELKRDGKHPTADQQAWLDDLAAVANLADLLGQPALIQVHVFRPADWFSGRIERILRGDPPTHEV